MLDRHQVKNNNKLVDVKVTSGPMWIYIFGVLFISVLLMCTPVWCNYLKLKKSMNFNILSERPVVFFFQVVA